MLFISVPLGGILAFLMVRTDLPGRSWLEPLLLIPVFVSPMVLAFGYVVAAGPVGFFSVWAKELVRRRAPWNVYSLTGIAIIAGLTHVPHVYLYTSAALTQPAAPTSRKPRASPAPARFRSPSMSACRWSCRRFLFAGVLVFFLGFEMFGLPLVLGDPEGLLVLPTYLYKLTNKLGMPSYHLMAAVAVCIVAMTFPLVMLQRFLLKNAGKYVTVKGKAGRQRPLPLGQLALDRRGRHHPLAVPDGGRAALRHHPARLREQLGRRRPHRRRADARPLPRTLRPADAGARHRQHVPASASSAAPSRSPATPPIGLATHRKNDGWSRFVDYLVLVPRAVPGLLAGLAFLWVFLFFPPLAPLRSTMVSLWLAYTVVWLAYGMRLVSARCCRSAPSSRKPRAASARAAVSVSRDVTLPLIRYGMLASWLLVFMIFEREYSTGVYLLGSGHRSDRLAAGVAVGHGRDRPWWPRFPSINVVHGRRRPGRRICASE